MGVTERLDAGPPGRPLLAAGLLTAAGLVDAVSAWVHTGHARFAVTTADGVYQVDLGGWAEAHLAVGAAVLLAGLAVFTGQRWTVPLTICCVLPAVAVDLLLLPYAPVRTVVVVALDGAALRLLLRHHRMPRTG
ncbi:hypothetical protein CO540_10830 [Micromonospora sp. WMMA2032]|uniref:DUF7144 family membrane protein n=1 Tax=Micromonospora sp. WMMA2032 TaxID=2039870 RepID=UPI000C05C275|nr:hypothetical protein [Micromonospora sp. WMMA2032]ATO14243.1 hypothetical protein CO540_10830 [Micromonospora sp. WMMA2032]